MAHIIEVRREDPCPRCNGQGSIYYSSTATWRGGMGGASMTHDVCDICWGSGEQHDPWTDLRKLRDEETTRVNRASKELFASSMGQGLTVLQPALLALADVMDREARRRKPPVAYGWDKVCVLLAKWLRRGREE